MMYFSKADRELVRKLVERAARNLLVRDELCIERIDEFADFLEVFSGKTYDTSKMDNETKSQYELVSAGIKFWEKIRLVYGVFDPLESFLIWMAIIEQVNPKSVLEGNQEIGYFEAWAEIVENKFLEKPSENLQKKMGLPIINCAITKVNMDINESVAEGVSQFLFRELKETFDSQHFILIDSSSLMASYVHDTDVRKISYISAILLEIIDSVDKCFINFHDEHKIIRKISIESDQDKRKFWNEIDQEFFSSRIVNKNSLLPIHEILESKEYEQCKSRDIEVCIDIIADKEYYKGYDNEVINITRKINSENIRINLFLLENNNTLLRSFLRNGESNLGTIMSKLKKKNLFVVDNEQLICYNG